VIDEVRLTYAALREGEPSAEGDLAVRSIGDGSPAIHLGLDREGRQHLLVSSPEAPAPDTGLVAIRTFNRDLMIGGGARRYLDVVCEMHEFADVFDHFVAAVLERAPGGLEDQVAVVLAVLDEWRSFFAEVGGPPARETLTAVIGELLLLCDVASVDPSDVLSIWVGPRGGRHDLRRGPVAVEVKTTRAHTARIVTVHGEDQLLAPDGGTLYLHFVRLEEVAGLGVCVIDLVDELVSLGVHRVELFDALTSAGIPPAVFPLVGGVRFAVRERTTFVVDDATPRIVPATFAAGERPAGVVDLVYRVDLDHIADRALDDTGKHHLVASLTVRGRAA
jgi:hypothetical protein